MIELRRVVVTFSAEEMEISATYAHDAENAIADVNRHRAEHASRLQRDVAEALERTATTLAQRARETSNLYAEYQAVEQDLRRLTPRVPQEENSGAPVDSAVLIGPMSTRVVSGPNPGQVEAVLSYLASLNATETLVGAVPGEDAAGAA
jgi:hypothetical protein